MPVPGYYGSKQYAFTQTWEFVLHCVRSSLQFQNCICLLGSRDLTFCRLTSQAYRCCCVKLRLAHSLKSEFPDLSTIRWRCELHLLCAMSVPNSMFLKMSSLPLDHKSRSAHTKHSLLLPYAYMRQCSNSNFHSYDSFYFELKPFCI